MDILITGAAGMIGSHLCDHFIKSGHTVLGVDNFITGKYENIEHLVHNHKSFHFKNHDITKPLDIAKLDWILHFASPASPVAYGLHPIETIHANTIGTEELLKLAKRTGASLLYASTSETYGDPLKHPQNEKYFGNVNTMGVRAPYDEAKRLGETLCYQYNRFGVDTRIVRIFNTYSVRMDPDDGRVISNFVKQAITNQPITLYGDGLQTRSFQYVDDLVAGVDKLMRVDYHEPVNIGNPEEYTVRYIANLIKQLTRSGSKIITLPKLQDDPAQRKPDITLARDLLKWGPKVGLNVGLKKVIDYYRARRAILG